MKVKRTLCPHDEKPCPYANRCGLKILEACSVCTEKFASVNIIKVNTCDECRTEHERINRSRRKNKSADGAIMKCTREFRCFIRDELDVPF